MILATDLSKVFVSFEKKTGLGKFSCSYIEYRVSKYCLL